MAASDYYDDVQGFFVAYYGRWADVAGRDFWAEQLDAAGGDQTEIINQFGNSQEYLDLYASYLDADGNIIDSEGLIGFAYQTMFDRPLDDAGRGFYTDLLNGTDNSGFNPDLRQSSFAEIILDIFNGAVNADPPTEDTPILLNKVTVAASATSQLETTGNAYQAADIAGARAILAAVDATADSVTAGEAAAVAFVDALPNTTFTLEAALAADTLPDSYSINPSEAYDAGTVNGADAAATLTRVESILADAENSADLVQADLFSWAIADTAEQLFTGDAINPTLADAIEGASAVEVTDTATAEQQAALIAANASATFSGGLAGDTLVLSTGTDWVGPNAPADPDDYSEVLQATANNDIIEAVSSSLASARTLNVADQLDGGEGQDSLMVDLQSNFAGFSGEGFMQNVEHVNLTNSSDVARSFSATGATGVQAFNLSGLVNLTNLDGSSASISLSDRDSGTFSATYAASSVSAGDVQSLSLNAIGTETSDVVVEIAEIAELAITATGDNAIDLNGADLSTLAVDGTGSLAIAGLASELTNVDAAGLSGQFTLAANLSTDLSTSATLVGSQGESLLALTANGAETVQYSLSGFEALSLGTLSGTLTFSGTNVTDLTSLIATDSLDADAQFINMGATDLNIELQGNNASAATITSNHGGATNLALMANAAGDNNNSFLSLTDSTAINLTLGEEITYSGMLSLANASTGSITQLSATDNTLDLRAAQMINLSVITQDEGDLVLAGGAVLTGLEELDINVATNSFFNAATNTIDFTGLATANLTGGGAAAFNDIGATNRDYGLSLAAENLVGGLVINDIDVGEGQSIAADVSAMLGAVTLNTAEVAVDGSGALTGSININADGTNGDLNFGTLTASSVTVNAAGALGNMDTGVGGGDLSVVARTADITGIDVGQNNISLIAAVSGAVAGGALADSIAVDADADAATDVVAFTLTGGGGADAFDFSNTVGALSSTITDFSSGEDTVGGTSIVVADTANAEAAAIDNLVDFLNSVSGLSGVTAGDLSEINANTNLANADAFLFVYDNEVHYANGASDGDFGDGDVFIAFDELTTLSGLNLTAGGDLFA